MSASAAAVEAAQKELGCEHLEFNAGDEHAVWCRRHHIIGEGGWTDRGCPVAVRVADAVVEAQG